MWRIERISSLIITILVLLSYPIFAQHQTLNDKVKLRNQLGQNKISDKNSNQDKIKNRETKSSIEKNILLKKNDIQSNKPSGENYYPHKKPIRNNIGICISGSGIQEDGIKEITNTNYVRTLEDVYPNFPLRFIKGEISYSYSFFDDNSQNMEDVYDFNVTIRPKTDDYYNAFGIMIIYSDSAEELEIFNEDESPMYFNNSYTYTDEIILTQTGYINLRIGYYNFDDSLFYPEVEIPNKTDVLIFIQKPDERVYNYE